MRGLQRNWDPDYLEDGWPRGLDNFFLVDRIASVAVETTLAGRPAAVLEVGAADAQHSCRLAARGVPVVALEPSPEMLARAAERQREQAVRFPLVRGIAEALPFRDGSFDRVLCESVIDHLAHPPQALAEMRRVLRADGRLLVGFVNYGGPTVRMARLVYGVARALGLPWSRRHLFWDSPVPAEHSFECTYPELARLCAPHFVPERAIGIATGWAFPGWGWFLNRLPRLLAVRVLATIDRTARAVPRVGDYLLTVWRPR
ncbi:MAG TPA: class I SAM-dependent methyltransferase [Candidatus Limnocylindria bacterium]|nr:class I SAM-dependent methyltransferase [Candidatus Limnocylindria bacterium]